MNFRDSTIFLGNGEQEITPPGVPIISITQDTNNDVSSFILFKKYPVQLFLLIVVNTMIINLELLVRFFN